MKKIAIGMGLLLFLFSSITLGQNALSTDHLYVIGLNGTPITINGELDDWADAEFIYISQDPTSLYNSLLEFGAGEGDPVDSPNDFSAHIAIKMDNDNMYFAAHVRDEGGLLLHRLTSDNPNALVSYDHLALYLGLYDIGTAPNSPHVNTVDIIDPVTGDVLQSGRTFRIKPGTDNDPENATLGADYQFGINIQDYNTVLDNGAYYASGEDVINYNYGYVDTTIANTETAILVWENEKGYTLEWKVPFASMAGDIAKPSKPQSVLEWPLFSPKHGDIIPFDFDITDNDRPGAPVDYANNYLRYGAGQSLDDGWNANWRDSYMWAGRAIIKEISGGRSASNFYHTLLTPEGASITVDGDLTDWSDAQFIGISQDSPNHSALVFGADQDDLAGPADFGGFIAIKMDDDNIYYAGNIWDEGGLAVDLFPQRDRSNANLSFAHDHFACYLGLYNIGDMQHSPHVNVVDIIDPSTGDILQSGRTYRVKPGADNDPDEATLGADYQHFINIQSYDDILANGAYHASGEDVINYNGGYVDTLIDDSEVAILVWDNEKGYSFEWKVPFASFAGQIAKGSAPQSVLEWPLYHPLPGDVLPFDLDITDDDRAGASDDFLNNFLRFSPGQDGSSFRALWRDSYQWGMRMKLIDPFKATYVEEREIQNELPKEFQLKQNYPNPFNPTTTIEFDIAEAGQVTLTVFNMLGQEIATLVDAPLNEGFYRVNFNASDLISGVYIYQLRTGNKVESRKMLLMK